MSDALKYRMIDLFAGAGGLTLGFYNSKRFESVFAVEFDTAAARTYAENFDHTVVEVEGDGTVDVTDPHTVFNGDIRRLGHVKLQADFIIGGPPCQGFSPLGKITPRDEHKDMNQLWQQFMRVVHEVRPLGFLIENVPELLRSREFVAIKAMAELLGYTVTHDTLKAVEFGVPQRRIRGFILAYRGGVQPKLPQPSGVARTVHDAIGDLPLAPTTMDVAELPGEKGRDCRQDLHIGRRPTEKSLRRYMLIEPGENRFALMRKAPELTPRCWLEKPTGSTDVFGRLRWDHVAYTIRTEFYKPEKGCYLHPQAHRPITHREAARLQTFDDWFYFHGSKIQIARQIGNAVPARLAQAIAEEVAQQLPKVREAVGDQPPADVDFEACLAQALTMAYSPAPLLDMLHNVAKSENDAAEDEVAAAAAEQA